MFCMSLAWAKSAYDARAAWLASSLFSSHATLESEPRPSAPDGGFGESVHTYNVLVATA